MRAEEPSPKKPTLGGICQQYSNWIQLSTRTQNSNRALSMQIESVTSPQKADFNTIVFAANAKVFRAALESKAGAICSTPDLIAGALNDGLGADRVWLESKSPERAMREVIQGFFRQTPYKTELQSSQVVHPTAVIDPTATIAPTAWIGPHAVIGPRAQIGERVYVGASSVVEADSTVGAGTVIHPLVYIGHSTQIGQSCEIHPHSAIGKEGFGYVHDREGHHRIPHQGKVVIGDRVHIGASCTIDRATFEETRIDSDCILDNRIHIAHNCRIGAGSIITAGLVVAGSTTIGKRFVSGGNVSITGHIDICDNVQLGGVSVVRKSITAPGSYAGNPLQPLIQATKTLSAMTRLSEVVRKLSRGETD